MFDDYYFNLEQKKNILNYFNSLKDPQTTKPQLII